MPPLPEFLHIKMAPTRKRLKTAHDIDVGLLCLHEDMLRGVCHCLQSNDLASMCSTSKHFGERLEQYGNLSLIEEMARQIVEHTANEEERSVLRRYEGGTNKIGLYKKLLMLRSPLLFEQLIGRGLEYVEYDKRRVALGSGYAFHTAIGNQVMSDGMHYANFTVSGGGENVYVGIIRPIEGWDQKGLKKFSPFAPKHRSKLLKDKSDQWGISSVHCCAIRTGSGQIYSTGWSNNDNIQGALAGEGWEDWKLARLPHLGCSLTLKKAGCLYTKEDKGWA